MTTSDYYKILGISKNATKEDIKKAYKQLAKKYHPDVNKNPNASEKFKEINEAASVLGDDEKRAQYDQFGDADSFKQASGFGGFDFSSSGFDFNDFASFDFADIFDRFFSGGSSFGSRKNESRRGADLRYDMEFSLEDAAFGTEKEISIPRNEQCSECNGLGAKSESDIVRCPDCNGSGITRRTRRTPFGLFSTTTTCGKCRGEGTYIKKECPVCDGTTMVHKRRKIKIKIPKGAEEGTNLRLIGEGEGGKKGASAGDLYIVLHMKEHNIFKRKGDNIHITINIPFTTAALGGDVEIPTLDGKAKLHIPPATQSNTVFRMNGKGVPYLHAQGSGDENVEVIIEVPKYLNNKQKELLKQFEKETGEKGFF